MRRGLALLVPVLLLGPGDAPAAGRGAAPPPSAPAPRMVQRPLHVAYRASLSQPSVRTASLGELRAQMRTVPAVAFVNGYWVVPVDLARVYAHPAVRPVLLTQTRDALAGPRLGLVFIPNELANLFQIVRPDLLHLRGVDVIRIRATGNWLHPSGSGLNIMTAIDWIQGAFHGFMAWWQNWQAERDTKKNCEDKGPTGDCDGDGVQNQHDKCPYDPTCTDDKNGFVGCVVITCQTFAGAFAPQMDTVIQQVAQQIRYSGQTANVVSLGSIADRTTVNVAFPPPR